MTLTTLLSLVDVPNAPRVKLDLPVPLRVGDRIRLSFRLKRQNQGRSEVLAVTGEYRVSSVLLTPENQHLSVESVGAVPIWRAVKKELPFQRRVPPARFPSTLLS